MVNCFSSDNSHSMIHRIMVDQKLHIHPSLDLRQQLRKRTLSIYVTLGLGLYRQIPKFLKRKMMFFAQNPKLVIDI